VIMVGKVNHVKSSNVYLIVVNMDHVSMVSVFVKWVGVVISVSSRHVHMNVTIMVDVSLVSVSVIVGSKGSSVMTGM